MSNVAIRVENLGKMYRIGGKQEKYSTLRDTLIDVVAAPFRKVRGLLRGEAASGLQEDIWALKDVSFEVKHGEVVGIIGRNGAGKSTLLKILSRITEPTTGYADVFGRVGALLEVGTGFHPELTGRENVYLNGAILGMTRRDIDRKFDEIVDFAGVEKFIDTPVKHYSSGMGLRLGFAVAAHLEPEILIVDEVLAVGDAEFQKKCLGKMNEVAGEGRTVLFVSHNLAAITALCTRGVLLEKGSVALDDQSSNTISAYFQTLHMLQRSVSLDHRDDRTGLGPLRFVGFRAYSSSSQNTLVSGELAHLELWFRVDQAQVARNVTFSIHISDESRGRIATLFTEWVGRTFESAPSQGYVTCQVFKLPLTPGNYQIDIGCKVNTQISDYIENASMIRVEQGDFFGTGIAPSNNHLGPFLLQHNWDIEVDPDPNLKTLLHKEIHDRDEVNHF